MTQVKVCGLREVGHALAACEAGANLIGFVFAPSPRQVTPEEARAIVQALPKGRVKAVGVFVKEAPSRVNEIAAYCPLDYVQLNGEESPEECGQIAVPVIRAFHVRERLAEAELAAYRDVVRFFLLDTFHPRLYGGTGQRFDWRLAQQVAPYYPILLAGGLDPENVAEAVRTVRPWGVDVSSGVETNGVKDMRKVAAFVQAVRRADSEG